MSVAVLKRVVEESSRGERLFLEAHPARRGVVLQEVALRALLSGSRQDRERLPGCLDALVAALKTEGDFPEK